MHKRKIAQMAKNLANFAKVAKNAVIAADHFRNKYVYYCNVFADEYKSYCFNCNAAIIDYFYLVNLYQYIFFNKTTKKKPVRVCTHCFDLLQDNELKHGKIIYYKKLLKNKQ